MLVQEPVHAAIWHCLNYYAYRDATFLAERLFYEVHSDESLHLLATCYYRSGKLGQAYDVLQTNGARTPHNKFLLAKCCNQLNKLSEAEVAILGEDANPFKPDLEALKTAFGELAGFALQLLASIYEGTERHAKAKEADLAALEVNPFLWKSFESLCDRGEFPHPAKYFNVDNLTHLTGCVGSNPVLSYANGLPAALAAPNAATAAITSCNTTNTVTSTPVVPASGTPLAPQSQNAPVLMTTMLTPVNQLCPEPAPAAAESAFATSAWSENSALSGVGALNCTANESAADAPPGVMVVGSTPSAGQGGTLVTPSPQQWSGAMPPPPPRRLAVGRRYFDRGNKTPGSNAIFRHLVFQSGGSSGGSNLSFGHLPKGPLRWSSSSFEPMSPNCHEKSGPVTNVSRIDGPLSILSPCHPVAADSTPSDNAENLGGPITEQKPTKRGLGESNALKSNSNIFSQNITPSVGTANVQSVRRSSRLYGSTQQSVKGSKENSKGPTSKSRKTKSKFSTKTPQADLAEKNERNKQEKEKELEGEKLIVSPGVCPVADVDQVAPSAAAAAQTQKILHEQALVIQKSSAKGLMELMRQLGSAYGELSRFNGRKAIRLLEEVPSHQRNTGWVLGLIGKSYFELGEYKEAKKYFKEMRDRDPHRMDLTEYYSTALWHLQEEFELSYLAQELIRVDKLSPHAWCAAGNCFSHQKEHENAIKFFQRAVQVDPHFSYAYTLLGHEYVMIEELEKALSCFRNAVKVDRRHYNAWYGIGLTYYKQERFSLAEIYYRKALAINPQSPVLMCHVAVVQHALQKSEKALETLNAAITMSPKNPLCKFERASVLFATERYQEALSELDELKILVPKESPVYFLIGKVHNKLGNTHLALVHFSWAMDLDPKGANSQIKDALDPALNRVNQEEACAMEGQGEGGQDEAEEMEEEEVSGDATNNGSPGFRSSSPLDAHQAGANAEGTSPNAAVRPEHAPGRPAAQDDSL